MNKELLQQKAFEYARNHSSAPDKETPDWIITDYLAGAKEILDNPELYLNCAGVWINAGERMPEKEREEYFLRWIDTKEKFTSKLLRGKSDGELYFDAIVTRHKPRVEWLCESMNPNADLQKENKELKEEIERLKAQIETSTFIIFKSKESNY